MNERVLVIAAHPDDEVLGCGGTMARHVASGDDVFTLFVADGETARAQAALPNRSEAACKASRVMMTELPIFLDLRDQRLDTYPRLEIVQKIEKVIDDLRPTVIYTHYWDDLNLDHQIVHRCTMTALRPVQINGPFLIYAFEVPSSTEWGQAGFHPDHFVNIHDFTAIKFKALECYEAEMRSRPHTRSYEHVSAMMVHRGNTVCLHAAEAFMTLRSIVR